MGTRDYILYMNYQNVTQKQNVLAKRRRNRTSREKIKSHTHVISYLVLLHTHIIVGFSMPMPYSALTIVSISVHGTLVVQLTFKLQIIESCMFS